MIFHNEQLVLSLATVHTTITRGLCSKAAPRPLAPWRLSVAKDRLMSSTPSGNGGLMGNHRKTLGKTLENGGLMGFNGV